MEGAITPGFQRTFGFSEAGGRFQHLLARGSVYDKKSGHGGLLVLLGDEQAQAEVAGMAQANRSLHGLGEDDAESAAWAPAAVIVVFASKALELDRPQTKPADSVERHNVHDCGQVGAALAKTFQFLMKHAPDKRLRRGQVFGPIAFLAAQLGITSDHERRRRHPRFGGCQYRRPQIVRSAQADEQQPQRLAFPEPHVAETIEGPPPSPAVNPCPATTVI